MGHYRASADAPDKAKALAAVLAVHAGLAAALLSGLNVTVVQRAVDSLRTFDIALPKPPPPPSPPPQPRREAERAKQEEGAAGKKAEPTPVVAPQPRILVPAKPPVTAAPVAGTGSAPRVGAADAGSGPGAGGAGSGRGGGGTGFGSGTAGFTPAQRIRKIPDREYRRIVAASGGQRSGRIGLTLKVNTDGTPSHCRIIRSSGLPAVDGLMCQLALDHVRFRPALDAAGRPVAQDITWFPDWAPNR